MDIDQFYEGDPRRRPSAEIELGSEWLDKDNVRHELNYVEDTGELYVMREPAPHVTEDPFGGLYVSAGPGFDHKMTVHVVATIDSVDSLHQILDGWQDAMGQPDGATWLGDRLRAAGVASLPGDPIEDANLTSDPGADPDPDPDPIGDGAGA
jgi:hypothetical protein